MTLEKSILNEIWKPVRGHDLLWVSNLGRIKSIPYKVPMPYGGFRIRELKPTYGTKVQTDKTYWRMHVVFRRKTYRISPLVCEAFNGPRPKGMVASHQDENSLNNKASNLKWATRKENHNMPKLREYHKRTCRLKMTGNIVEYN